MTQGRRFRIDDVVERTPRLALGTAFYKTATREVWFGILDRFVEAGGAFIDTARDYGESEAVMGAWLASRGVRDRVIVATKGGQGRGHGLAPGDFAATIETELAGSLDRLGTDTIDVYLLHRDSPGVPVAEIVDSLNVHVARGAVRALGASNWTYARVIEANEYARRSGHRGFSVVSNNLSLAVPTAPFYPGLVSVDPEGERWHQQAGTLLLSWSSQARGFFAGRFAAAMRGGGDGAEDGFTRRMVEVYGTDGNLERLRRAAEIGREKGGYSATQVALAWLLHRPFPVLPIVGVQTEAELRSCLEATSLELTAADLELLRVPDADDV